MIGRITLPKSLTDFLDERRVRDLREALKLVNALQRMTLVINNTTSSFSLPLNVSEKSAMLSGEASFSITARYLLIGGGASGRMGWLASANGGGGSAGEFKEVSSFELRPGTYDIKIGRGGVGSAVGQGGEDGESSLFGDIDEAIGGGRGGGQNPYWDANRGAYGGGGGYQGGPHPGALGLKGRHGGTAQTGGPFRSGGGGGAGGDGFDGGAGSTGGDGKFSDITGTRKPYAAGGGGAGDSSPGNGGSGIGGNGAGESPTRLASAGQPNTGSGGGGGASGGLGVPATIAGGSGADGLFVIRYPGPRRGHGGIISSVGSDTVHIFTSSGKLIIS